MKTLADFKRAMQLGTVWQRRYAAGEYEKVQVIHVGSHYVRLKDEKGKTSRLDFPLSDNIDIKETGEVNIYFPATYSYEGTERIEIPRRLVLTYRQM